MVRMSCEPRQVSFASWKLDHLGARSKAVNWPSIRMRKLLGERRGVRDLSGSLVCYCANCLPHACLDDRREDSAGALCSRRTISSTALNTVDDPSANEHIPLHKWSTQQIVFGLLLPPLLPQTFLILPKLSLWYHSSSIPLSSVLLKAIFTLIPYTAMNGTYCSSSKGDRNIKNVWVTVRTGTFLFTNRWSWLPVKSLAIMPVPFV